MKRKFYKMHALGNDYIYFDCFDFSVGAPAALAVRLSDRRRGIGGDGIILLEKSEIAHAKMRIFNADGSEAEMCGNGVRCAAKFLRDRKGVRDMPLKIETLAGVISLMPILNEQGETISVCAETGKPVFSAEKIPTLLPPDERGEIVARSVRLCGINFKITCVSYGNPHCVTFSKEAAEHFETLAAEIESAAWFPQRINAEFVRVNAINDLSVRVYERGSGETFACGTGACAAAAAAIRNGYAHENEEISVRMHGGDLSVKITEEHTYLTGEAAFVFVGEIDI